MEDIIFRLKSLNLGKIETDVLLENYTTYKVGGLAKCIIYPKDLDSLIKLLKLLKDENVKYMVLGKGSNVLFSDSDYDGIIIKLDNFNDINFIDNKVIVGAGASLIKLACKSFDLGLSGLEFGAGIPGSVGGAVYMNAGAYNSDIGSVISNVKVLTPDMKIVDFTRENMNFGYRTSFLKNNVEYICLEVTLELEYGNKDEIKELVLYRKMRRFASQPLEYPSAGSVFRNPEGMFSGKLIEDLGLKGFIKGGAKISEKHANFIVNFNKAKASDIKFLIDYTKNLVKDNYCIDLIVEQELINWDK